MLKILLFIMLTLTFVINAFAKEYIFYSLQLGTFKDKRSAEKFLLYLKRKYLFNKFISDGFVYKTDKGFFTVRVGLEKNKEKLSRILNSFIQSGYKDVVIVPTDIRKLEIRKIALDKKREKRKRKFYVEEIIKKLTEEIENVIFQKRKFKKKEIKDIFFDLNKETIKLLSKKGLYITGNGEFRSRHVFSDEYSPIRWKASVGLEFNLLRTGIGEKEREKHLLALEEFKRSFLLTSISNFYVLDEQIKVLNQYYLQELREIYELKFKVITKFEAILKKLVKLDKTYITYLKLVDLDKEMIHREIIKLQTIKATYITLPIIDIDLNNLNRVIKTRKQNFHKNLEKLIDSIWKDIDNIEIYHEGEFKFFFKYNLINTTSTHDFLSLGLKFKLPFPPEYHRRKKIYKLELKFFEQETTGKFYGILNDILDYAIRLKQNSLHIKKHIIEIKKDLIKINKDLLLWKMDIKTPNYGNMYENIMDILNRMEIILNYKIINYIYAMKIIYFLNLSENEIKEVFYGEL